ncbi:hypothetical protein RclHR1_19060002 [Rhizophagus clarus]|uniref:HAT C-terminal dimerisation domain-containing protein n=1 Tax=Rhizophagus clarus TaxID=94130 RepID=A0A2Z6QSZ7_9GLOM|nr:hypothetical protein RclHR1_19060002 [Rhizophagus clarus]
MNIRCITHSYNLISKNIIQHTFAVRMIQRANRIVQFFKKSHKAAAMLKEKIKQHKISGGGLKIYIETHDMQYLSEILLPIKNAILAVEAAQSTLANAYINFLKIAATIQNLSTDEYKGFHNHCIRKFNYRFEEFNDPAYQLAFFLHPVYKSAGLKFGTFLVIANYAGQLWQRMGETKKSCEQLITQLHHYKNQNCIVNRKLNPYMAPYSIGSNTPLMWWNTCEVKPNYLQRLAIMLFSITPSFASYKLEGLAKIYQFNLSNTAEQLYQIHEEIPSEMVKNIAETVFNELEEEISSEEPVSNELPNPAEHLYTDELNLNLNISDIVDF